MGLADVHKVVHEDVHKVIEDLFTKVGSTSKVNLDDCFKRISHKFKGGPYHLPRYSENKAEYLEALPLLLRVTAAERPSVLPELSFSLSLPGRAVDVTLIGMVHPVNDDKDAIPAFIHYMENKYSGSIFEWDLANKTYRNNIESHFYPKGIPFKPIPKKGALVFQKKDVDWQSKDKLSVMLAILQDNMQFSDDHFLTYSLSGHDFAQTNGLKGSVWSELYMLSIEFSLSLYQRLIKDEHTTLYKVVVGAAHLKQMQEILTHYDAYANYEIPV